jgi:hypothetical protein
MPLSRVRIESRESYAEGESFAKFGPYVEIKGYLDFKVDPTKPENILIKDLDLAPKDSEGLVQFSSKFILVTPENITKDNNRIIVDVVNRGRARVIPTFNRSDESDKPAGDGFLLRQGYSVISIGWQWDVIESADLLGLTPPYVDVNEENLKGETIVQISPNHVHHGALLANRIHVPYSVADINDVKAKLIVRDWEDGPDQIIDRSDWSFAIEENGNIKPDKDHIYYPGGFIPGKYYYIVYHPSVAPVVGTGLLALRDIASFLKKDQSIKLFGNKFEYVYGYGVSQTARMLRHLVYLGLNTDENGIMAFDAFLPHVGGSRMGEFNNRFAQPSQQAAAGFGHTFPFDDNNSVDMYSKQEDGLLNKLRNSKQVPKIIYTNSSSEYWRGDGSLAHIHPNGYDLEPASETRRYHFSGTQHGAGYLGEKTIVVGGGAHEVNGRYTFNLVDYRPLLRAALNNLDLWVREDIEPPASKNPSVNEGTAILPSEFIEKFIMVPGIESPSLHKLWGIREIEIDENFKSGVGYFPVKEGRRYQNYVANIDSDGNELGGIRLPDLDVPVGTHTGWNLRHPDSGSPDDIIPMKGISSAFADTKENRNIKKDPRPSLEERYGTRGKYFEQVLVSATSLAQDRYLLKSDIDIVVEACMFRYDAAIKGEF